jgi:hypothetical protein
VDLQEDANVSEEHTTSVFREAKSWYLPTNPHGFTSEETNIVIRLLAVLEVENKR